MLHENACITPNPYILLLHIVCEQAQANTSPSKINVTIKSPVGDISVVTLIRTDTTLDHSEKAGKVCTIMYGEISGCINKNTRHAKRRLKSYNPMCCIKLRASFPINIFRYWHNAFEFSSLQLANSAPPLSVTDCPFCKDTMILQHSSPFEYIYLMCGS